jgi:tetratricopeptide (TPR) repeat protein
MYVPDSQGAGEMEERQTLRQATKLWRQAYRHQIEGELDRAIELYRNSIEVYPTAEAHTFLGWAMSFQGRLEDATRECLRAIEIDSEFGNPYNDIGVYLMQQDKLDESISWLEKAKQAKRYEPRQFPFLNLGRIYLRQGRWWEALREFEGAVRLAPRDVRAARILHRLRGRMN